MPAEPDKTSPSLVAGDDEASPSSSSLRALAPSANVRELSVMAESDNSEAASRYAELATAISAFMDGDAPDDQFNDLALEIHEFQVRHNAPYANYCRSLPGDVSASPSSWREIPAVPGDAFKQAPLAAFPVEEAERRFNTSGTTGEHPGRHYFLTTHLYRESILRGWRALKLPEHPVLALTPSPSDAPHSSLSFMMGVLAEAFGAAPGADSAFAVDADGGIDLARLEAAAALSEPLLLLGTALAFLHVFESLGTSRLTLPSGSVAMETGGYKGTRHSLDKAALYARFEDRFGLSAGDIVNEYGMTELSSQFYTRGLGQPHCGPHWMRARVLHPGTREEVDIGETGVLVITDLANLGSCVAIETRDLAVRRNDGAFELIGRDPAALPRGCSRAADEIFSSAHD